MQDTTPHLHAQAKCTVPEKPIALKEAYEPNEQLSSLEAVSLNKQNVNLGQEDKALESVLRQPVATGISQEFRGEVCIYFDGNYFLLYVNGICKK